MTIITNDAIPKSNGHYSQCVEHNGLLYLSGQLPLEFETKQMPKTIEEQTDLVLSNTEYILEKSNSCKNNILQVRVYIPNIDLWDKVNERYSMFFKNHKPARTIVPTNGLHFGSLIEIEVTAAINN
jgi:2-iminobutanoate/2-iminopropanoate deaminase